MDANNTTTEEYSTNTDNQSVSFEIAQMVSNYLFEYYSWIKFLAIIGIILSVINFINSIFSVNGDIFDIISCIFSFISSFYLLKACREIKKSREYCDIATIKNSMKYIGRHFLFSVISFVLLIIVYILMLIVGLGLIALQ